MILIPLGGPQIAATGGGGLGAPRAGGDPSSNFWRKNVENWAKLNSDNNQ